MPVSIEPTKWTAALLSEHLQDAVELELFVIPVYLTAYYSINRSGNRAGSAGAAAAAAALRTVVNEEMLHLQIACNVLNALGVAPRLTGDAAPRYPRVLPFHKQPLSIALGPATDEQLGVFMAIELPTWADPDNQRTPPPRATYDTIGEFYHSLIAGLKQVFGPGGAAWPAPTGAQLTGNFADDNFAVGDLKSAIRALKLIVVQGEGMSKANPHDDIPNENAHYYQFKSMLGRLGPEDLFPLVRNCDGLTWSERCGALLDFFDAGYSAMLAQLEANCRGQGDSQETIFGSMAALGALAADLAQISYQPSDGAAATASTLTPRFSYTTLAPAAAYAQLAVADQQLRGVQKLMQTLKPR